MLMIWMISIFWFVDKQLMLVEKHHKRIFFSQYCFHANICSITVLVEGQNALLETLHFTYKLLVFNPKCENFLPLLHSCLHFSRCPLLPLSPVRLKCWWVELLISDPWCCRLICVGLGNVSLFPDRPHHHEILCP